MDISILAADGSFLANNGSNAISILAQDGSLMTNNGSNGISILNSVGAYAANGTYNKSILGTDGALKPYEASNTYSILDTNGALALPDGIPGILGAERLTNGSFASAGTGWTVTGNDGTHIVTFSGGTMRYDSPTSSPILTVTQAGAFIAGRTYRIVAVVSAYVAGSLKIEHTGTGNTMTIDSLGTHTHTLVASSTSLAMLRAVSIVDLTLDSISVKEVL